MGQSHWLLWSASFTESIKIIICSQTPMTIRFTYMVCDTWNLHSVKEIQLCHSNYLQHLQNAGQFFLLWNMFSFFVQIFAEILAALCQRLKKGQLLTFAFLEMNDFHDMETLQNTKISPPCFVQQKTGGKVTLITNEWNIRDGCMRPKQHLNGTTKSF